MKDSSLTRESNHRLEIEHADGFKPDLQPMIDLVAQIIAKEIIEEQMQAAIEAERLANSNEISS